jgi:hypothetical protein
MTRRDSLRRIGGGLLGALAAGLGAGRATAGKPAAATPCVGDITQSPYLRGCELKCAGEDNLTPRVRDTFWGCAGEATDFDQCVMACVYCADPWYPGPCGCPAAGTAYTRRDPGLVCTAPDGGIYCYAGSNRTCANALSKNAQPWLTIAEA